MEGQEYFHFKCWLSKEVRFKRKSKSWKKIIIVNLKKKKFSKSLSKFLKTNDLNKTTIKSYVLNEIWRVFLSSRHSNHCLLQYQSTRQASR